jgi:RNA polymerase sigma-70 factor, ECF subfamily
MERQSESDEGLMCQVSLGRREPVNMLLRRYATPLLTFLQRMLGDRHQAEELFQEVFLAVWTGRRTYDRGRPFRAWLFGIAMNKCRAALRQRRTQPVPVEAAVLVAAAADCAPDESAMAAERAALVAAAMAELPELQRMVMTLRIWQGLSYAEIATVIDRTESTARSHMFHALATVRAFLERKLK